MPPMKDMPISISISSCASPVLWELSQIWSSAMQMPGASGVGQISISICRPVRSAIVSPSIRTLLLLQKPFFFPCLCACPCAQCIFMVSHAMSVSASFRLSIPTIVSTFLPSHSFARLKSSIDYLSIIICVYHTLSADFICNYAKQHDNCQKIVLHITHKYSLLQIAILIHFAKIQKNTRHPMNIEEILFISISCQDLSLGIVFNTNSFV